MFRIFCEASRDMFNKGLILREETKGPTSRGDSKTFFTQQKSNGLVATTIVYVNL